MRFCKKDIQSKNNYAVYRAIAIILILDFNKQFHKQFIILHDISEVDGRINEGDTHHFHTNKIQ